MSTVTPSNDFVQIRPEVQNSRVLSQPELTDYEIRSMEEQQRRLKYFTDTTNEELQQKQEQQLFINLSLVDLLSNMSKTIITIINELIDINQDTTWNDVILIFIKNDRLVYIGILLIIVSLCIYLIDITN